MKANPVKAVRIGGRTFDITGISADDNYFNLHVHDDFEPEFQQLCDKLVRYDYVCADLGANIGMKTLMLAQYVPHGTVLAVEGAPKVSSALEKNVVASGLSNVSVVSCAVGDANGIVRFADDSAWGRISKDGVEVPVRTLQTLVKEHSLPRLDFLKIDVEGYEFPILKNSLDFLNRHQTLVFLEFNALTQMVHADVSPRLFSEWIFANFANVFLLRPHGDELLQRLAPNAAMELLYYNLAIDASVSDLLVTNFAGRLDALPNRLSPLLSAATAKRDLALIERDAAQAQRDAERASLLVALRERDAALAERDAERLNLLAVRAERDATLKTLETVEAHRSALFNSTSWRMTAPVRAAGSLLRR